MPNLAQKLYRSIMLNFAAIPLFVGSLATGYGLYVGYQKYQHIKLLTLAQGTVIGNELHTHSKSIRRSGDRAVSVYHPVVKFKATDGSIVQFTDSVGTQPPDYQVGTSVEVLYNSKNKQQAQIKAWKRQWLFPTVAIAFGSLAILVGVIVSVRSLQSDR